MLEGFLPMFFANVYANVFANAYGAQNCQWCDLSYLNSKSQGLVDGDSVITLTSVFLTGDDLAEFSLKW